MVQVHRQMQWGFLVMPAALGSQLVAMLLVAHYLGPGRFGVFSVVFAIMSVASFITEMGIGTMITKLVAEGTRSPGDYIGLALPVVWPACLVAALAQAAIVWVAYSDPSARWAGVLAGANILAFGTSMVFSCALRGMGRMGIWMRGFLGQKVVFLVLTVAGLGLMRGELAAAIGAWALASVLGAVYYLMAVWGEVWRGRIYWDWPEVKTLVRESIPIGLISAANQFGMQLDTFILAILLTNREVGLYALGQRLVSPARNILHGAVSTPTFPGLCRLASSDRDEFAAQASRLCVLQWVAALPLVVIAWVVTPLAVPRLLSDFSESVPVIWIAVWALAPACLVLQLRYVYTATSGQGRFLGLNLIQLLIKGGLLVVLALRFGILGACVGTVAAEIVFGLLAWYGTSPLGFRLKVLSGVAGPTVFTALFLAAAWLIGLDTWIPAVMTVAYLGFAAVFVNRLLRRAHRPDASEVAGGPSATETGTGRVNDRPVQQVQP